MIDPTLEYISVGANRHPATAHWLGNTLAFGAGPNVALWSPKSDDHAGVKELLSGHADTVNAVRFINTPAGTFLLTGSADKTLKVWATTTPCVTEKSLRSFACIQTCDAHQGAINCIEAVDGSGIVATGATDATIKIWQLAVSACGTARLELIQVMETSPRFFPLALAMRPLGGMQGNYVLAAAGTQTILQLYVCDASEGKEVDFKLRATLKGHEGWIRSLAFTQESDEPTSDLLLASASQDKYIRLWRIHQGEELPASVSAAADPTSGTSTRSKSLSNKAHRFSAGNQAYSATFEALLLGHDDWIFSSAWRPSKGSLQLLSASADNTLAIWEPEPASGVWVCITRLGEISAEKGSTTATGSMGGFWSSLWSPCGTTIVALGRTGSWRRWDHSMEQSLWLQGVGTGGHIRAVTGISWSNHGEYLLSTSSDQTTRLHAQWKRGEQRTWHEMSRPQIHGYDLNCIGTLGATQYVSGADEKLLRVFVEPKAVATSLQTLSGIDYHDEAKMPAAANIPVLGLSNKAIDSAEDGETDRDGENVDIDLAKPVMASSHSQPPTEDQLARHTLWPEIEKLYGHGYEISTLAVSFDGKFVATACKASSVDHAVIRIFDTREWREVKPPLMAHSLTVTRVRFSYDDMHLLSVGRDRQWALFQRNDGEGAYQLLASDPKAHSRMILDAAWIPGTRKLFATAGRDKQINLWELKQEVTIAQRNVAVACVATIRMDSAITAIDCMAANGDTPHLAVGLDNGDILVLCLGADLSVVQRIEIDQSSAGNLGSITQVSWQPRKGQHDVDERTLEQDGMASLAVASEDQSLRIYSLKPSS